MQTMTKINFAIKINKDWEQISIYLIIIFLLIFIAWLNYQTRSSIFKNHFRINSSHVSEFCILLPTGKKKFYLLYFFLRYTRPWRTIFVLTLSMINDDFEGVVSYKLKNSSRHLSLIIWHTLVWIYLKFWQSNIEINEIQEYDLVNCFEIFFHFFSRRLGRKWHFLALFIILWLRIKRKQLQIFRK